MQQILTVTKILKLSISMDENENPLHKNINEIQLTNGKRNGGWKKRRMNLVGVHARNALGWLPVREDGVGDSENAQRRRSGRAPARGIGRGGGGARGGVSSSIMRIRREFGGVIVVNGSNSG